MKTQQRTILFLLTATTIAMSNGLADAFRDPASQAIQRTHGVPRGGSSTVEEAAAEAGKELLSKENLGAFFAVNGIALGLGFTFATGLMMKIMHNFELGKPRANKAVNKAGASMLAYGTLAYGTIIAKLEPAKSMGYSLLPFIANIFLQDVLGDEKSTTHKLLAGGLTLVFAGCAYRLIINGMSTFSALFHVTVLGLLSILSMLFPVKMRSLLEYKPIDTEGSIDPPEEYQMKFITQAIGVHTMCYLALCVAFYLGKDPYQAVGYATGVMTLLAVPVCLLGPNLRKSNAPLWPMFPFITLFAFMTKKMAFVE